MNWLYLFLASLAELFWVLTLKYSSGFTNVIPSVANVLTMIVSAYLLSLAMRSIPMGICYAVWTGAGAIFAAALGSFVFNEHINSLEITCLFVIITGVIGLKLFNKR